MLKMILTVSLICMTFFYENECIASESKLEDLINFQFVNEQHFPLMLSPKTPMPLAAFHTIIEAHQETIQTLLTTYGVLLIRGFPIASAQDFASTVKGILGKQPIDYRGGEGSRKKIAEGVYTSTEAPPQYQIPLHNELSCTSNPRAYIAFY